MAEAKTKEERAAKFKRHQELLVKIADALETGSDPFAHGFLVENNVTAAEVYALSSQIGTIIKGYLGSEQDDRMLLLAIGAVYGEKDWEMLRENFKHSLKMNSTLKKLKAITDPLPKQKKEK